MRKEKEEKRHGENLHKETNRERWEYLGILHIPKCQDMRNISELTDRHGKTVEKYRYDAFGGLYTGVTAPYNTIGYAGKQYDPKANLVDMQSRWYAPQNGRFTTPDSYRGDLLTPYTQNRYAYVGNNPVNRWDPLGYSEEEYEGWGYYWSYYQLLDNWTDWDYNSSTYKGSDGYYTSWSDTKFDYWLWAEHNFLTWVEEESETDYYLGFNLMLEWDETVYSGTSFTAFTSQQWYEEHKSVLAATAGRIPADKIIPPNISKDYNRVLESSTFKYSSMNPSSGTSVILSK